MCQILSSSTVLWFSMVTQPLTMQPSPSFQGSPKTFSSTHLPNGCKKLLESIAQDPLLLLERLSSVWQFHLSLLLHNKPVVFRKDRAHNSVENIRLHFWDPHVHSLTTSSQCPCSTQVHMDRSPILPYREAEV